MFHDYDLEFIWSVLVRLDFSRATQACFLAVISSVSNYDSDIFEVSEDTSLTLAEPYPYSKERIFSLLGTLRECAFGATHAGLEQWFIYIRGVAINIFGGPEIFMAWVCVCEGGG